VQYPAWQRVLQRATPVQLDMLVTLLDSRLAEVESSKQLQSSVITIPYVPSRRCAAPAPAPAPRLTE